MCFLTSPSCCFLLTNSSNLMLLAAVTAAVAFAAAASLSLLSAASSSAILCPICLRSCSRPWRARLACARLCCRAGVRIVEEVLGWPAGPMSLLVSCERRIERSIVVFYSSRSVVVLK